MGIDSGVQGRSVSCRGFGPWQCRSLLWVDSIVCAGSPVLGVPDVHTPVHALLESSTS